MEGSDGAGRAGRGGSGACGAGAGSVAPRARSDDDGGAPHGCTGAPHSCAPASPGGGASPLAPGGGSPRAPLRGSTRAPRPPACPAAAPHAGAPAGGGALYESDAFRIGVFKVLACTKRGAHDWCGRPGARAVVSSAAPPPLGGPAAPRPARPMCPPRWPMRPARRGRPRRTVPAAPAARAGRVGLCGAVGPKMDPPQPPGSDSPDNPRPHPRRACPFAHPGEKARRRPLDKVPYGPELCGFVRRGRECPAGDACLLVRQRGGRSLGRLVRGPARGMQPQQLPPPDSA
jgi:hypothetical protein